MPAKPVLFVDFDGTLCFDRYWRSLSPEQHAVVQRVVFGSDATLVRDWMTGKHTSEEINRLIAEEIGIPYEQLWELFVRDCETMQVDPAILSTLDALRIQYHVVLITGNMDSFTRFTVPALGLDQYFDEIVNSYYQGTLKSDESGKIFTDLARKYGVSISDCILIDDSAQVCGIFSSLDGTAYQVTPQHDISHYLSSIT